MIEKGAISIWYNQEEKKIQFLPSIDFTNVTINFHNSYKKISSVAYGEIKAGIIYWIVPYTNFMVDLNSIVCEILSNDNLIHREIIEIKQKIALCISGVPRYYRENIDTFNRLKKEFKDIDVFAHLWYDVDKDFNINNFIELYQPKSIMVEKYDEIKDIFQHIRDYNIKQMNIILPVLSMYYSIYKSNELKRLFMRANKERYKYSIRYRTDVRIINLDYNELKDKLESYSIIIPMTNTDRTIVSDFFAVGESSKMDIYSGVWNELKMIIENSNKDYNDMAEYFLNEQLNNYDINYYKQKCDFELLR
jgi:hypothetical protein